MSTIPAARTLVLAGDIGGTNTNLALVEARQGNFTILLKERYPTQQQKSLIEPMARFIDTAKKALPGYRPELCCISGAGPVTDNRIALTNAPWSIEASAITANFSLPVTLINDFTAISYGVILLDPHNPKELSHIPHCDGSLPVPAQGAASLVIGAGTGLGTGYVVSFGSKRIAFPSEGGHSGIPCIDALSYAFYRWIQARIGYPPGAELAISGQGIDNIFSFICSDAFSPELLSAHYSVDANSVKTVSDSVRVIISSHEHERPAMIAAAAAAGEPRARLAMELFTRMYARVVSDLSALFLPYSGVYLAGGITAKNEAFLRQDNRFMRDYEVNYAKHIRAVLQKTPVMIVRDYSISLVGAANAAVSLQ